MQRPNSKNYRLESSQHYSSYSPRNMKTSPYFTVDHDPQSKLSEKIYKLKNALKAAEKHNGQLHAKVKYYKDLYQEQVPKFEDQLRRYRKKYGSLQHEHDKKLQEFHEFRVRSEYEQREVLNVKKEHVSRIKDLESKIFQLQAIILDLNGKIGEKKEKIKSLQSLLEKNRKEITEQYTKQISKLENQLTLKTKQAYESTKELSTVKDSIKEIVKKLEKANLTIYQQAERYKLIQDQFKEGKKNIALLQRDLQLARENAQSFKSESIGKINTLEKSLLQKQFEKQRISQKYTQQTLKNDRLQSQLQSILTQYNNLQYKYEETISSNYELQKDFDRQLHIIAKQMARRHMISKSMTTSTTTTSLTSNNKKKLMNFQQD